MFYIILLCIIGAMGGFLLHQHVHYRTLLRNCGQMVADESVRANHWYSQFNAVLEGPDGAWAKERLQHIEALEKGLDEAVDDHAQESETWEEQRAKFRENEQKFLEEIGNLREHKFFLERSLASVKAELTDVRETALQFQIDLTAPTTKTPAQIFEETRAAQNEVFRKLDIPEA